MKKVMFVSVIVLALSACGNGENTGKPNSGVIPHPLDRDGNGSLIHDTEKGVMTGQWCHELDPEYQRIGAASNCVADY